jgi:N-acetylmuramoyl-L-alanine amidase
VQPRLLDDGVRLEIALSGPAEFRWRRLPRPDRVYVDIVGAKLPGMPYELNVGAGGVDRLWARQNAWDTVRVVATLTDRMAVRASRAAGGEKIVVELRREGTNDQRPTTNDQRPTTSRESRVESSENGSSSRLAATRELSSRTPRTEPSPPPLTITEPRFPPPAEAEPTTVMGLVARNLSQDRAEIRVKVKQRLDYRTLRLENPSRFVVDIPGGRDGVQRNPEIAEKGLLEPRAVTNSQFSRDPLVYRLVVKLPEGAWPEVRTDEDSEELVVEVTRRAAQRADGATGRRGDGATGQGKPGARSQEPGAILVGIDPGHGGSDPGAMPLVGMAEKEITLDIAHRVRELLEEMGVATAMTRREDRRLAVKERKRFVARADLDLLLSIHCDAAESRNATGVTTYTHGWDRKSRVLAGAIQSELVKATGLPDRGVRADLEMYPEGGFYVLRHAVCPAVLIEAGYVSHPPTALRLSFPEFRQRVAQGIVAGLRKYWKRNDAPLASRGAEGQRRSRTRGSYGSQSRRPGTGRAAPVPNHAGLREVRGGVVSDRDG